MTFFVIFMPLYQIPTCLKINATEPKELYDTGGEEAGITHLGIDRLARSRDRDVAAEPHGRASFTERPADAGRRGNERSLWQSHMAKGVKTATIPADLAS